VFNLYGPNQPPGTLIPDLLARFSGMASNSIGLGKLSGAGNVRDFVPVELVARVIVELATRSEIVGVQHASTGAGQSVGDVARWIMEECMRARLSAARISSSMTELPWLADEDDREPSYSIGLPSPIIKELAATWPIEVERDIRALAIRAARHQPES
jgi:nucleoside-diphosphate-sugar epimerase